MQNLTLNYELDPTLDTFTHCTLTHHFKMSPTLQDLYIIYNACTVFLLGFKPVLIEIVKCEVTTKCEEYCSVILEYLTFET